MITETTLIKTVLLAAPLALDSFAVAAALGMSTRMSSRARWRITGLFTLFEAGMPVLGSAAGSAAGRLANGWGDLVAGLVLVALGAVLLIRDGDDDQEAERARSFAGATGFAIVTLGIAISIDELAVGFGAGVAHTSLTLLVVLIAAQTVVASQIGMAFGSRITAQARERVETVAAAALVLLGAWLIAGRWL